MTPLLVLASQPDLNSSDSQEKNITRKNELEGGKNFYFGHKVHI